VFGATLVLSGHRTAFHFNPISCRLRAANNSHYNRNDTRAFVRLNFEKSVAKLYGAGKYRMTLPAIAVGRRFGFWTTLKPRSTYHINQNQTRPHPN
jgi:hypothetical protein